MNRRVALASEPVIVRPFVKWAGGKRQLLPQLRRFTPIRFGGYMEPFLGSGAVFFDLACRGLAPTERVWLTDTNRDLLGTYSAVAADVATVIELLERHAERHAKAPLEYYYRVRDREFNPRRRRLFEKARAAPIEAYPASLAAMFIYLNRTGFNGLFRLNASGGFNVPVGRYANPHICDADNLRAAAGTLRMPSVTLQYDGFESVLDRARAGDYIYFDPPYAPVSATANFTGYTAAGFGDDDQRRLQRVAIELARRGCFVTISNSTAPIITNLYGTSREAKAAGFAAHRVPARRAINANPHRRGDVDEYIVSNVDPAPSPVES